MVNPFINTVTSWFLKKRIHQIELFLKYPNEVQNELLLKLLNTAKNTSIGKLYDFNSIKSYNEFTQKGFLLLLMKKFQKLLKDLEKEKKIFFGTQKLNGSLNLVELQILKVNLYLLVRNL